MKTWQKRKKAKLRGIKYFINELRKFKWYYLILPFLACGTNVLLSLIVIVLPKIVLDSVHQKESIQSLFSKIMILGLGLIIISILEMFFHNMITYCSQNFLYKKVNVMWIEKAITMDYHSFVSNKGKNLMEKVRTAISSPNWGIVEILGRITSLMEALLGLVVYCFIVGKLHFVIVIFLLLLFAIEMSVGALVEKKKQTLKDERANATRRINYIAYRTKGMKEGKDIRIFSMVDLMRDLSSRVIADKREIEEKTENINGYHYLANASLIFLRNGFAYLYLCSQFVKGNLSIGDFTLYFAAITGVGSWLTQLANAISQFVETNNYIKDFMDFIQIDDMGTGKKKVEIKDPIEIEFKDVSFSYFVEDKGEKKEIVVLDHFNIKIPKGEKLAVVGMNGAGKTTFIKLLCGLLNPTSGQIFVNGMDTALISKKDYYALFAVVFQHSQVLPVSIADNIMLNIDDKDHHKLIHCLELAALKEKVDSLPKGLDTCLRKTISEEGIELSGGQEQRLFLARALYKDAPFLVLDEPTAALDPIAENDIYQKYSLLVGENKTSVFVSHRLASTSFCDRIILLENGKVKESGTHDELLKLHGTYYQMYEAQSEYYRENDTEGKVE